MRKKLGFSKQSWIRQQEQLRKIQENKQLFEQERQENARWTKRKSFRSNKYLRKWAKFKDEKEAIFTDLTLNSISVCDAAAEVNEALLRGLGLKGTAIDMDDIEDLSYKVYIIKLIETLCSSKCANLSRSASDKVISAAIAQILPPSVPQKPIDPKKGEKLIEELAAMRSSMG